MFSEMREIPPAERHGNRDRDHSNCIWGSIDLSGWPEDLRKIVKALQAVLFWLTVIALIGVFFSMFSGPVSDTFTGVMAVIVIGCGAKGLKDRNRSLLCCFSGVSLLQGVMYLLLLCASVVFLMWLNGVDQDLCFALDETHVIIEGGDKMAIEGNGSERCACTTDRTNGWVLNGNNTYTCEKDCFKLPICDLGRLQFAIVFGMLSNLIMAYLECFASVKARQVIQHSSFNNAPEPQMMVVGMPGRPMTSLAQPMVAHGHTIPVVIANPLPQQSADGSDIQVAQAIPISHHQAPGSTVPVAQASLATSHHQITSSSVPVAVAQASPVTSSTHVAHI
jgi:hypothetical protein